MAKNKYHKIFRDKVSEGQLGFSVLQFTLYPFQLMQIMIMLVLWPSSYFHSSHLSL